LLGNILKLFKS